MLDKTFSPKDVEQRIYDAWERSGAFKPHRPDAEPFCIVIPPPNVTGRLHIGHALNNTLQDILARFERMRGKDVLWQPGTDHAGIATQMIVERQLAERQMSRAGLGREKFLEEVWKWKAESGGAIVQQQRRLGASADWSRERFTMDDGLSRAVLKTFVELHKQGLIYKDKRLVNWDPRLQTAVSDLEVENIEMKGHLWYLKYPLAEGATYQYPIAFDENGNATEFEKRDYIVVATTRPETMLGDTAVAVHPDDKRYKSLIAAKAKINLPLSERLIPIIADEHSDPEKGTGAVKITPGHDFNDFEVGKRHKLPLINILNKDGTLNDQVPEAYRGLDRFVAREQVVADLEAVELVDKIEPITHAVPHDEKTKTVVLEPLMTEQWYLNVQPLADKAIKAVETGATKFVPENWSNVYFHWMRNIQPWCISRQLWWGHQIPAWYLPAWDINLLIPSWVGNNNVVTETEEDAVKLATKFYADRAESFGLQKDKVRVEVVSHEPEESWIDIVQEIREGKRPIPIWRDPDVLDTWFSSALWPFSTLGWPDKTPELARFYPTSVLVTGFDIIFFWVARMMMMGLWFMDEVPFHTVFIHTRVLDEKGAKMSKTKGNVVDPLDLIDEFGADALRFTLSLAAGQGRDMRIGASRVEINRNFATKLWNAARFCEMNGCVTQPGFDPAAVKLSVNKWIVAETRRAVVEVTSSIEALRFNDAANFAYSFVWDIFCDWYLEFAKPLFNGSDETLKGETRATAAWVRDQILKLLHPFMPFITEELWERTAEGASRRSTLLIEAPWPTINVPEEFRSAAEEMLWVIELIKGVRSVRAEMNVPPAAKIAMVLKDANAMSKAWLDNNRDVISTLARLDSTATSDSLPKGSAQFVLGEATIGLPLGDVIDFAKERARLEKELKKAQDEIGRIDAKLANEQFVSKAPEDVLTEQREKRAEYAATAVRLQEAVARLA